MFIYIIKCSSFYKIGFSKNPKNRLKTIKTHNPLDVKIYATLKTDNYLSLEKELHNIFSNKHTRGEWFELKNEDLQILKIDYGFDFKFPISKANDFEVQNKETLNELKGIRIDNHKFDVLKNYFEDVFNCIVKDNGKIKKCCIKFDTEIIKKAIDSLYTQDYNANNAYDTLFKVCVNMQSIIDNPVGYVVKIIKAIHYKQYRITLDEGELRFLSNNLIVTSDIADEVIKTLNSKKFYLDYNEFWDFIINEYTLL